MKIGYPFLSLLAMAVRPLVADTPAPDTMPGRAPHWANSILPGDYADPSVVQNDGPNPQGEDYENGWKFANELRLPMVDEHGYKSPQWLWDIPITPSFARPVSDAAVAFKITFQ